jgi:glutamate decarboxylase
MVHLSRVHGGDTPDPTNAPSVSAALARADTFAASAAGRAADADANADDAARFATTAVYGSRFAAQDLPQHTLPDEEMPREVAYRMIKDELSLDGNPKLNLASFVTTYMEDEAERLMTDALPKNFIDYEEYPQTAEIHQRCVNIISNLYHAPTGEAVGTSTIGSSEAIMLAVLAMKRRWANALPDGPERNSRRPNLVMSSAVQVCWEKAARYLDVDARFVDCTRERFVLDSQAAVDLVDGDTIGICLILGTTYTGEYEDVRAVNDLLQARDDIDPLVGIHVDAASGGFVAPFVCPDLEWDFRLPRVVSINVSGHKYGLVYPGVGWVVWRSPEFLPRDLVFNINYLGADQATFTLNFSKGAAHVIGQYYQLVRLGRRGYAAIMQNLTRTADALADALESLGFVILSARAGAGLPLVAFRFATEEEKQQNSDKKYLVKDYDEFALARTLRSHGWIVPAYTMAPAASDMKLVRVVVREDLTRGRCDTLIRDIMHSLAELDKNHEQEVLRRAGKTWVHAIAAGREKKKDNLKEYENEVHSLQGKTGKTHAVC